MTADEDGARAAEVAYAGPEYGTELSVGALADDRVSAFTCDVSREPWLERPLRHPRVQKCGLALAGHFHGVVPTRVQVLGETELSYLESLAGDARSNAARGFFSLGLSCVVVTREGEPPRALVQAAEATGTPLFVSSEHSSPHDQRHPRVPRRQAGADDAAPRGARQRLRHRPAPPRQERHRQEECALELVLRGHRLVADDVVRCEWRPPGMILRRTGGPPPASHRSARSRRAQHQGSLRRHERERAQAHRRRGAARRVERPRRVRPARRRRARPHRSSGRTFACSRCPSGPAGTWAPSSRSPRATSSATRGEDTARTFIEKVEATAQARGRQARRARVDGGPGRQRPHLAVTKQPTPLPGEAPAPDQNVGLHRTGEAQARRRTGGVDPRSPTKAKRKNDSRVPSTVDDKTSTRRARNQCLHA